MSPHNKPILSTVADEELINCPIHLIYEKKAEAEGFLRERVTLKRQ